ncbi:MAG: patatin-like phospholipase family protein [Deltaproteobacteria bacterium]|nr:patatin-like phospholipase family protein [Deltaproteobacteria bacterium]
MSQDRPKTAIVLSGGAARGAYEAGVLAYIRDGLVRDTGVHAKIDILCGSSVGAINACVLAATMDQPETQGAFLARRWSSLNVDEVVPLKTTDLLRFTRSLFGAAPAGATHQHGGVLDPAPLERVVLDSVPWSMIQRNLAEKRFEALAISATHVSSGHTVIFVERDQPGLPPWGKDPFVHGVAARIRPQHALASAAIPIIFPAVSIDGQYYCDGGLRLNTPLAPALRLGAERVLVISLRHRPPQAEAPRLSLLPPPPGHGPPSAFFLAGKVINALWLDHIDYDLDRMRQTTGVLEAGRRAFGPGFDDALNAQLAAVDAPALRPIRELRIEPSVDLGVLAKDVAASPEFARRSKGVVARLLQRYAQTTEEREADLCSYLLFDASYCAPLVELGIADARAMRDELAELFR